MLDSGWSELNAKWSKEAHDKRKDARNPIWGRIYPRMRHSVTELTNSEPTQSDLAFVLSTVSAHFQQTVALQNMKFPSPSCVCVVHAIAPQLGMQCKSTVGAHYVNRRV